MAKYKAAGKGRKKPAETRGLVPCLILLLAGIVLFSFFFYYMLKSSIS